MDSLVIIAVIILAISGLTRGLLTNFELSFNQNTNKIQSGLEMIFLFLF